MLMKLFLDCDNAINLIYTYDAIGKHYTINTIINNSITIFV